MYNNNKSLIKFSESFGKIVLMIPSPIRIVLGLILAGFGALILYDLIIGNNDFSDRRGTWVSLGFSGMCLLVGLLTVFASLAGMIQDAKLKRLERELDRE